ncbi:MAG: hypothetical protein HRU70_07115 [Phycisphaeraceae bacterium]|nr:MAG: hypothetical protein HRU70_07115 [Phycisphaeraceae bacterium]
MNRGMFVSAGLVSVLWASMLGAGGCSGGQVGGKEHEFEIRATPPHARISVIDQSSWLGRGGESALNDGPFLDSHAVALDPASPRLRRHAIAHVVVARDGGKAGYTRFTPSKDLVVRVEVPRDE